MSGLSWMRRIAAWLARTRIGRSLSLSWPARVLIVKLRLRTLSAGRDIAGAVLLLHHLAWVIVMAWPGPTLVPQAVHTRSSLKLFIEHGGDRALLAVYGPLLLVTAVAVLRLSLSQRIIRGCLLGVASVSVGLAITYLTANVFSALAWDSAIRALVALWAYGQIDEE